MRIGIVDDHEIVREGLKTVLASEPGIEVVGVAASGREAITLAKRALPDLMLVDFRLPDTTGDVLCRTLRKAFPSTAVMILTTYLNEDVVQRSIDAGAAAYVTKAAGSEELLATVRELRESRTGPLAAGAGASAVVKRMYDASVRSGTERPITPQQERVLELVMEGLTYGTISRRLHISESTVRFHVQSLKDRLGVRTKAELIATAIRLALVVSDDDEAPQ